MPGPGAGLSATLNYQLTDFATGHMNDLKSAYDYVERICPTVKVPGSHGQFKKFDDVNSFQIYNTSRALGADPTRIVFAAEDEYYNCAPQALEVTVDEEERRQAGENNAVAQQLLDEGKIKAVLNAAILSAAYKRTQFVINNTVAVTGRGNFSNPNIDPIDQIEEQLDLITLACGSVGQLMITMDTRAWRAIRSNPLAKRRIIGVQMGMPTVDQFKDCLYLAVDVDVANFSYVAAPGTGPAGGGSEAGVPEPGAGEIGGKSRLLQGVGGNVLIHYSVPNPTIYDPSAFKAFLTGTSEVQAVRSYMAPNGLFGGHIVDWSEDVEQTSTEAMVRLQLS
jgi:hypothetical protein